MSENEISRGVLDAAFRVHTELGPGLLESAYEKALKYELERRGYRADRQVTVPVRYDGLVIDEGFVADLIVNDLVIIELKSVEQVHPLHKKQLLTYLKLTGKRLGLLLNFNCAMLKEGITRIANGLIETGNPSQSPPRDGTNDQS